MTGMLMARMGFIFFKENLAFQFFTFLVVAF